MDKEIIEMLARRAGLQKALAEFPDDVAAAARQADDVASKIKPVDPRAEPWPPMQAGKGYSLTLKQPRQLPSICSIFTEARVAVTPMDGALRVGGELHAWQEGRVVVFDDTYEHEAWNRSAKTRVVLIFDIWNPHLTQAEQAALTHVVESLGDFRKLVEAA